MKCKGGVTSMVNNRPTCFSTKRSITFENSSLHPYQPKIGVIQNMGNQQGYKIPQKGTRIGEEKTTSID
ncbi:MAG: hypothetical protein CMO44_19200 [Verrucomicrobiales bacterium]|nr:hypothetical protein [Verrucomicrobiales bacterium]